MITVEINQQRIPCPTSWNELNKGQLLKLSTLLQEQTLNIPFTNEEDFHWKRIRCALILVGQSVDFLAAWSRDARETYLFELAEFIQVADWLFRPVEHPEDPFTRYELDLQLTRQLLPKIKLPNGPWLYGPADDGYNIIFEEFKHADRAFEQYAETRDTYFLDRLIAILYRPHKKATPENKVNEWNGDRRQAFGMNFYKFALDKRIEAVADLALKYKYAVMLFYASLRRQWIERNPVLFRSSGNPDPAGWNRVHFHLAEGNIMNDDAIGQKPVNSIFFALNMKHQEAQELKKRMAASRRK